MSEAAQKTPTVHIEELPRAKASRVAHLQLPPAQRDFVGQIAEMVADPDPMVDLHCASAVVRTGAPRVVGFFKIDPNLDARIVTLPPKAPGLRGLLIGGQFQRFGFGSGLLAGLRSYIAAQYPRAGALYLSVDVSNEPARRAYLAHGWHDTYLPRFAGRCGPEHIMHLALRP